MEEILIGTTDRTMLVYIADPASTTGQGKTGLTGASFTVSYTRVETDNDVVVTDVTGSLTTLSALTDAHADWGMKEVSSTLCPGVYRLDVADAVFATGAWYGIVSVMITTGTGSATSKAFKLVNLDMFSAAAIRLSSSAGVIIPGTVDTTGFSPTTTEFEADDITEATADHYNGRIVIFTSGAMLGQAASISDYALATGRGHFTVPVMTEAPANDVTFIII